MNDIVEQLKLAERLRKAREYVGHSQQEVADCLGLHRPAVSEIEAGRRKVEALELSSMARMYCKPVAYFLSPEEMEPVAEIEALVRDLDEQDKEQLLLFAGFLRWQARMEDGG